MMQKIPKVSVVVPVYKVEAYLQECIDSILAQTYVDYELILVDDGSPDASGGICDENAARDTRIRVIHQENQGVTRARANGVAAARGEFITFVDSDDTIPPHALGTLVAGAEDDVDIVLGKLPGHGCPAAGELSLQEYRKICVFMNGIHRGPMAKLFRRSLFNEHVFALPASLRIGEDAVMNIRLAYRAQGRVICTATEVYEYRFNENSAINNYTPEPEMEMLLQTCRLESVPESELPYYISCGLYKQMVYQWMTASCHTIRLPESVYPFHRFLVKATRREKLNLGMYPAILFYCRSSIIRGLVIGVRNILHRLQICRTRTRK